MSEVSRLMKQIETTWGEQNYPVQLFYKDGKFAAQLEPDMDTVTSAEGDTPEDALRALIEKLGGTPEEAVAFTTSDRGFKQLEPILCTYSSTVRVYESSAASAPRIWLNVKCDPNVLTQQPAGEGTAHLSLEQAEQLSEQLQWLLRKHYQLQ